MRIRTVTEAKIKYEKETDAIVLEVMTYGTVCITYCSPFHLLKRRKREENKEIRMKRGMGGRRREGVTPLPYLAVCSTHCCM